MKPVFAVAALAGLSIAACSGPAPAAPEAPPAPPAAAAAPAPATPASATGANGAGGDIATVPAAFIGEWNSDPKDCGKGHGEGTLTIEAHRIFFYESGGPIEAVTMKEPRLIQIAAKLTGEGETWTDVTSFRLSADGKTLTDASVPGEENPMSRTRCG
jgi:hypothetical protein